MKRYLRRGYRKTTDVSQPARIAVLVDDDHPFGDVISDLLTDEFGCSVLVCTNADQVEPMVLAVRADLVLLDLVMPGGSREALRALKANSTTRLVPVIVCTAATVVDRERDELLALGAAAILAKPFDVEDLVKLVGQHLPARRAPLTTAVQKPIRRGYFPDDVASAFSRWLDSPGARLLMLTSSNPGEFARQARSVWVASWRACAQVVYGLPDDQ